MSPVLAGSTIGICRSGGASAAGMFAGLASPAATGCPRKIVGKAFFAVLLGPNGPRDFRGKCFERKSGTRGKLVRRPFRVQVIDMG